MRGTPQQIIDKYNQLARDAQLGGDRVATENFQQHAEHYLRMLGAAQKEQEKQREQQDSENRKRQAERDRERARQDQDAAENEQPAVDAGSAEQPDVIDTPEAEAETGLVETPENKSEEAPKTKPKRSYNRKPRAKRSEPEDGGSDGNAAAAE